MFRFTLLGLLFPVIPAIAGIFEGLTPNPSGTKESNANQLPLTKLAPAKHFPDLCRYHYRVSTTSDECQKFVDQALGYFYSYVWIEAARSAETALKYDPECAFAWMMLHRGIEKYGKGDAMAPLKKAQELLPKASHREQMLITAKLWEKGLLGTANDDRKKKAAAALDEMLIIYDDDEEAWFARGALHGGTFGGGNEGVPYYKALLKINPLHPGANHELVHFYENTKRPALGFKYAEAYIESSPGIPHAWHMQAHLAMRIGKWEKTTDRSAKAIELQQKYHKEQNVKPSEDHQYAHHLETLAQSLIHDGRYTEALKIREECEKNKYSFPALWFRVALAQQNWTECDKIIAEQRKRDKVLASYFAALMYLDRGEPTKAQSEIESLRLAQQSKKNDKRLNLRFNEVQGRFLCQTGQGEAGLKLLERNIEKVKDDYNAHAWGGGGYYIEAWGIGALEAGDAATAEEAFLEALAHDAGSARAALGMYALCDRVGRSKEAEAFLKVARRLGAKADPKEFERLRLEMVNKSSHIKLETLSGNIEK